MERKRTAADDSKDGERCEERGACGTRVLRTADVSLEPLVEFAVGRHTSGEKRLER